MKISIRAGEVLEHDGSATLKEVLIEHDKSLLKEFIVARGADDGNCVTHFLTP